MEAHPLRNISRHFRKKLINRINLTNTKHDVNIYETEVIVTAGKNLVTSKFIINDTIVE